MNNLASIYDQKSIESIRQQLKIDPGQLRHLKNIFFKRSLGEKTAIQSLPPSVRQPFSDRVRFHTLRLEKRFDSSRDGASKLILRTTAGYAIESIILRAQTGRVSLCVSSQVGCAAKCDFCATGRMGMAHNLSPEEMLDQLVLANEALTAERRRVRNIVFMGMGEPFHNVPALRAALGALGSSDLFCHPASRVLVSTVGIPDRLVSVATDFPSVNYAISLHSVTPHTRQRLIPLANQHSLEDLRDAIMHLNRIQPVRNCVMIEYLMLDGLNDSDADARQLVNWLDGTKVHINLIPFNRIDEAPHLQSSSQDRIESFRSITRGAGIPTTIRYSMGSDIEAACGQLVRHENRENALRLATARR